MKRPANALLRADSRSATRLLGIVALGVVLLLVAAWWRPRLIHATALRDALEGPSCDEEMLDRVLDHSRHPEKDLQALWTTGKIPHRRLILAQAVRPGLPIDGPVGAWIREAAADPDAGLRELALGFTRAADSAETEPIVGWQLVDPDPELRRLGLQSLRRLGHAGWTPLVLPLLEDKDPSIALSADNLLRRWSRRDSGLKLSDALPNNAALVEPETAPEMLARLNLARQQHQAWWSTQTSAPKVVNSVPPIPFPRRPVADFNLIDLDGRERRLSEFRGRMVLLNFWATWCTPCLNELPILRQLQIQHSNRLAILGISLDSLKQGPAAVSNAETLTDEAELHDLRKTLRAIAGRYALSYPVLLDPKNKVGRRFDGGQLPTQVLIDADGRLCRRFVGNRSLSTWERMLLDAESSKAPVPQPGNDRQL
ncbi:MAG: redoxin domain-containing protein [Verrucomicrobiales bacterium]|nr:redoxin domain-containing protein [Verrucomicrobiales bacterium]